MRLIGTNQRQVRVSGQCTLSFSLGNRVKVLTFQTEGQYTFPVLLGTPGLSTFKCFLHFDDDQDPCFALKAEWTVKKEELVAFLEEKEVLMTSEAIPLFPKETVTVPLGMKCCSTLRFQRGLVPF